MFHVEHGRESDRSDSLIVSMAAAIKPRPDPLPLATRVTSLLVRLPLFSLGTAAFGSASLLASLTEKDGRRQHRIAQAWARSSLQAAGVHLRILGAENLERCPVAVYASNHLSYMDTPAIFAALPFQFRIVARHSLFTIPFIGWHLQRSGQIPVNVTNPRASIASLSGGVKALKAGTSLFIFPEGGRSNDGYPRPFLNGPAFMAIRAQVPIVPMALVGTHEVLPVHTKTFQPGAVTLHVGEPMETQGLGQKDVEATTVELARRIATLFYEHSWRTDPAEAATGS